MQSKANKPAAYEIIDAFKADMNIVTDDPIIADGKLHRCHINGHKSGTLNGAYVLHLDGTPAGYFEDFTTDIKTNWKLEGSERQPIDHEAQKQIDAAKTERAKQRLIKEQKAARTANYIYPKAPLADPGNTYLIRKGIQPHGAKQGYNGALILPLYDAKNDLVSLQFIHPDGTKRFLKGGNKKGCFWWIGQKTDTVCVGEGFVTCASIFEATGYLTVIAYDAGNLEAVAKIIRDRQQAANIVICADNDESGVGQEKANRAAHAVNGLVAFPPIPGDFNDWAKQIQGGGDG
ncbi:toprim domain-containing protein [Methyloglobulus sp.]|uniref:toprim domain-containing protein n=1 Tax=Methyloglobulus sp. TaxID=2518622 RepID=UPI0039898D3C